MGQLEGTRIAIYMPMRSGDWDDNLRIKFDPNWVFLGANQPPPRSAR
jgi:hypothetical protein